MATDGTQCRGDAPFEPSSSGAEAVDHASVAWRVVLAGLARLPQGALSRVAGRLADIPLPRLLRRPVLGLFVRATGIDMSEAERGLHEYSSVNTLFVRRLRPGVRSWPGDREVVGCPVDGAAGRSGAVREGRLIQAKGRRYSAADLLGDPVAAEWFDGGSFLTLYLSPRDYHRIHSPCGGGIVGARHVPGSLLPVNPPAVAEIPELFARNERLVVLIEGPVGRVAVVAVGAYNVGRISAAFDRDWTAGGSGSSVTNHRGKAASQRAYDPPIQIEAGDEIMAFHLGSSVVVLLEAGVDLEPSLAPGRCVRLGQPVARQAASACAV